MGLPRQVAVRTDRAGTPVMVGSKRVEQLRDEWRVQEGWWTRGPVHRVYYELVLDDGSNTVVFCDRRGGCWYTQRA